MKEKRYEYKLWSKMMIIETIWFETIDKYNIWSFFSQEAGPGDICLWRRRVDGKTIGVSFEVRSWPSFQVLVRDFGGFFHFI